MTCQKVTVWYRILQSFLTKFCPLTTGLMTQWASRWPQIALSAQLEVTVVHLL